MTFDLDSRVAELKAQGINVDLLLVFFVARLDRETAEAFLTGHGIIQPFDDAAINDQAMAAVQELAEAVRHNRQQSISPERPKNQM